MTNEKKTDLANPEVMKSEGVDDVVNTEDTESVQRTYKDVLLAKQ